MSGSLVGYEFLRTHFNLSAFMCARPARIGSVTKVIARPDGLQVPAAVAPVSKDALEHVLFALKHEGINLQVLAQSLPLIPTARIIKTFRKAQMLEQVIPTNRHSIPAKVSLVSGRHPSPCRQARRLARARRW